ncbi:hypothetical protein E2C01_020531 [Portunus trituberculatus]|uniref:Uncharacterized protein n=1 Tax=Portunus trituberculatus TaxID=210409 RepID=A0A5B7E2A7_PORTR|nr:hypothetical protein [Portunus trituberculatus]
MDEDDRWKQTAWIRWVTVTATLMTDAASTHCCLPQWTPPHHSKTLCHQTHPTLQIFGKTGGYLFISFGVTDGSEQAWHLLHQMP